MQQTRTLQRRGRNSKTGCGTCKYDRSMPHYRSPRLIVTAEFGRSSAMKHSQFVCDVPRLAENVMGTMHHHRRITSISQTNWRHIYLVAGRKGGVSISFFEEQPAHWRDITRPRSGIDFCWRQQLNMRLCVML